MLDIAHTLKLARNASAEKTLNLLLGKLVGTIYIKKKNWMKSKKASNYDLASH
jgi:hypothetical protein